jgi:cytochrome c553
MRNCFFVLAAVYLTVGAQLLARADNPWPVWAYPVNPPGLKPAEDDGTLKHVPNSEAAYTVTQVRDLFSPPDWHPDNHPSMPDVVGRGNKPGQFACGFCHLPNGLGRPENSSLAGLSATYIAQQVADFRSGARKSSEPASLPVNLMIAVAKLVSEEDTKIAAEYFASLRPIPWIRVVETETVPKTKVGGWMLIADDSGGTEPIGSASSRCRKIWNVPNCAIPPPVSSLTCRWEAFARASNWSRTGRGKMAPCAICHGADLKGLGPVPALAGRSPSYVVRQLYDMREGVRKGQWSALMKSVVAAMSDEDMVAIAAYTASLAP